MRKNVKDIYVVFLVFTLIQLSKSLRCYVCFEALDPTLCTYTEQCSSDARCSITKVTNLHGTHFHLGCTENIRCHNNFLPSLVGRKRQLEATTNTIKCCDTDLCNSYEQSTIKLQSTTLPTTLQETTKTQISVLHTTEAHTTEQHAATLPKVTPPQFTRSTLVTTQTSDCVDHESCSRLSHITCNNSDLALYVCPKSCNKCTELVSCVDQNPDCETLIRHFSICITDVPFAKQKCKRSCNFCGQPVTSTISMVTGEKTTTVQSVTTEYPDVMSSETITNVPDVYTSEITNTMGTTDVNSIGTSPLPTHSVFVTDISTPLSSTMYLTSCGDPDYCLVLLQNGYELCNNEDTVKLCPNLCNGCANTTPGASVNASTTETDNVTTSGPASTIYNTFTHIETTTDSDEITDTGAQDITTMGTTNNQIWETTSHDTSVTSTSVTSCGDPEYCLVILRNGYDLCSNMDTYSLCPNLCDGCKSAEASYSPSTTNVYTNRPVYTSYNTINSVETKTKDSYQITTTQAENTIETSNNHISKSTSPYTSTTSTLTSCGDPDYCLVILQNGYDLCSNIDTYSICQNMCDGCKHSTVEAATSSKTTTIQSAICTDPDFCIPILNNDYNLCNNEDTAILCPHACGKCTDVTGTRTDPIPVEGIIIG